MLRVTYIGHATLLIELGKRRILTDPNFDPALGKFLRRVSSPGIALTELPQLDAILLTHAHADHLSFDSLDALPSDIPLFAPPAIAKWLSKQGYSAGDTALTSNTTHLVERHLMDKGRNLDLALLPIGHAPWWKPGFRKGHLTSSDALTLFERLKARYFIPYHWGTFNHVTSTAFDAIDRLRVTLEDHPLHPAVKILEPGTTFVLPTAST